MSRFSRLLTAYFVLLLYLLLAPAVAQTDADPNTAEDVISRYLAAIGAERFSSVTTFVERGDLYGNLTGFWIGSRSPGQSLSKDRGTYEFYFKSPNLRYSSSVTDTNRLVNLHGCDGKLSWYINTALRRGEFTPKPGNEYDCASGFESAGATGLRKEKIKTRLAKKKTMEGHTVWEVKVEDPKAPGPENYYLDATTFLLFRRSSGQFETTYSDYRDVAGMKFPFTVESGYSNSKLVTTIRELKINAPVDDARFIEPQIKNGMVSLNPDTSAKTNSPDKASSPAPATQPSNSASSASATKDVSASANPAGSPTPQSPNTVAPQSPVAIEEVNFPNFTSCTLNELEFTVPDLKGLKPAPDQAELIVLLTKIGAKTIDIARNTPNLISRESVTESIKGVPDIHHDYDYLIVTRILGNVVGLDEFRVDIKTGDKYQTDAILKDDSLALTELEHASQNLAGDPSQGAPFSQGFATSWVDFYPLNRSQAMFRYLGTQRVNRQQTLVLAFAQKPESVISPAIFRFHGKVVPMFLQGVAWVDPSDFRILRLRTDLLSPLPEVSLHRLTADIQFVSTRIEDMPVPLWLPREVTVISDVDGSTLHEIHQYSDYHLFRAKSRIVVDP